jgi:hypothetical protein
MPFLQGKNPMASKSVRKIALSFCAVGRTRLGFGTMGTQDTFYFVPRTSPILSWNVWMTTLVSAVMRNVWLDLPILWNCIKPQQETTYISMFFFQF